MEGLAPIDGWASVAILAKAAGYGAALLAMGGPLFVATFPEATADVRRRARTFAVCAALIGLAILAMRFGIRAARISGMGLSGAVDPVMLGIVWESPLGAAGMLRGAGLALVVFIFLGGRTSLAAGLAGALLIAVSYTRIGHALGDPHWLLTIVLTLHLLAAAFWVGALAPLGLAAGDQDGALLLHRFGTIASFTVALLAVAGLVFAGLMAGSLSGLLTTAYGWALLAKLAIVSGLLCIAAINKWSLVPALASGAPFAASRLRLSIRIEAVAIALILIITATLTSVTTPPINL